MKVQKDEDGFHLSIYTTSLPWDLRKNSLGTKKECLGYQGRTPWAPKKPNFTSKKHALGLKEKVKSQPHVPCRPSNHAQSSHPCTHRAY